MGYFNILLEVTNGKGECFELLNMIVQLIHVCLSHVQYGKQIITYRNDTFQQFRKGRNVWSQ